MVKNATKKHKELMASDDRYEPAFLASVELFDNVPVDYLIPYLQQCSKKTIQSGEILLDPQQPNEYFYIVYKGRLSIHLGTVEEVPINIVETGDCLGELSFIDKKNPSAYVKAMEDSQLLVIGQDIMWSLIDDCNAIARNLLYIVCDRLRNDTAIIANSEQKARRDPLTGILNRYGFDQLLRRLQQRHRFEHMPMSLIMADIDYFKRVNDRYGHLIGDQVLALVAQTIYNNVRPTDHCARYGGEEFAIILPNTELSEAAQIAERVRVAVSAATLEQHEQADEFEWPQVTISLGVAQISADDTLTSLVDNADQALYRAKRLGRNRVCD